MTSVRRVVLADLRGSHVVLLPVARTGLTTTDVRALVEAAVVPVKAATAAGVFIAADRLADVEAMAELRGVVVQRRPR